MDTTMLFIDTSAWLAYLSPKEKYHPDILKIFNSVISSRARLFTSNDIIDETITRLNTFVGWHGVLPFLEHYQNSLNSNLLIQFWTTKEIQSSAITMLEKYSDHRLSLTDTTSAVLMKKHHILTILTTDHKHFTTLGFRVLPQPK